MAFDGKIETAWCNDGFGKGRPSWVRVYYNKEFSVKEIDIINGYAKDQETYKNNNRASKIIVYIKGKELREYRKYDFLLKDDTTQYQNVKIDYNGYIEHIDVEITDVYKGKKYDDTCISDIVIK